MLMDLHSSCCARRGVRRLDMKLSAYHLLVLDELEKRNVKTSDMTSWRCYNYLGRKYGYAKPYDRSFQQLYLPARDNGKLIYPEHDANWMSCCLRNLSGVELVGTSVEEMMLKGEISGGCQ